MAQDRKNGWAGTWTMCQAGHVTASKKLFLPETHGIMKGMSSFFMTELEAA
jgi:hypothetical protein